ncbi:MAG TPA: GNAT family N-acetyltransferase [Methylomirabilota bacterium]|nr:GNAT family N-acetyltransferase [Methylomirabilota bacterium]
MEKTEIVITKLTTFSPEIAEDIRQLASKIGNNYKSLTNDDIKEMLSSHTVTILAAKDPQTKQIVGMITLIVYRIPYVRKAYLDDLIVHENYRGQGIGSLLMEEAAMMAKEKGAAYVDFTARPRRTESNSLYEKLGFKKRETNIYRLLFDYGEV